ncbi:MAG: ATP/GTP-binding protein, partial [Trebonia sp.]
MVQAPLEHRGSTVQVCGLWPFAVGTGTPMIGVPLGRSILNDATLCCDPISWFQHAKLIHNPSCFYLGKPGLGKSSVLRRQSLGLAGFGVLSMFLGDTKGEHVDLVQAQGGAVFRLGPNRDYINVVDVSDARAAERRLREAGFTEQAEEVRADADRRRLMLVETLITISRKGREVTDRETALIGEALAMLDAESDTPPVLPDLVRVIEARPEELRVIAMDRGDSARYQDVTENLLVSLRSLTGRGRLGEIFSRQSTVKLPLDRSCVFDLSAVRGGDDSLLAAALVVCWAIGFGAVNIGQVLAECGLGPLRHWFVVLDELWRALRAGAGMVDRVDELTRLNRQWGTGVAMCTHTMSDLDGLPNR